MIHINSSSGRSVIYLWILGHHWVCHLINCSTKIICASANINQPLVVCLVTLVTIILLSTFWVLAKSLRYWFLWGSKDLINRRWLRSDYKCHIAPLANCIIVQFVLSSLLFFCPFCYVCQSVSSLSLDSWNNKFHAFYCGKLGNATA